MTQPIGIPMGFFYGVIKMNDKEIEVDYINLTIKIGGKEYYLSKNFKGIFYYNSKGVLIMPNL